MKKMFIFTIISILGFILVYFLPNRINEKEMLGAYANKNFNYGPATVEIPYEPDTLILYDDNKFYSPYWGPGEFKISYSVGNTNIRLLYNDGFGTAAFNASVSKSYCGPPKIILNRDHNHYYEKIQ